MARQSAQTSFSRRSVAAALCCWLVAPVASARSDEDRRVRVLEACQSFSGIASSTMKLRQLDMPIREALEVAKGDGPSAAMTKSMTLRAYETPRMQSNEGREMLISDFASQEYLKCIDRLSE